MATKIELEINTKADNAVTTVQTSKDEMLEEEMRIIVRDIENLLRELEEYPEKTHDEAKEREELQDWLDDSNHAVADDYRNESISDDEKQSILDKCFLSFSSSLHL